MHHIRLVEAFQEKVEGPFDGNLVRTLFCMLRRMSMELSENPEFYRLEGESGIWALFPRSCFLFRDLVEEYGKEAGLISGALPLSIRGITEGKETGELKAGITGETLEVTKSNVSGRDYDSLSDVCVRILIPDGELFSFLWETFKQADFRKNCIVIPNGYKRFAVTKGLIGRDTISYFGYAAMEEYLETEELLGTLKVEQMAELWTQYFSEKVSPLEFEWLFEEIGEGNASDFIRWELSLRLAVERLGIRIKNEDTGFCVRDRNGEAMKFDYASTLSAEKVFLKLLFPAPPAGQKS